MRRKLDVLAYVILLLHATRNAPGSCIVAGAAAWATFRLLVGRVRRTIQAVHFLGEAASGRASTFSLSCRPCMSHTDGFSTYTFHR